MSFKIVGARLDITTQTSNYGNLLRFDFEVEGNIQEAMEFINTKFQDIPYTGHRQIYEQQNAHPNPSFVKINGIRPDQTYIYQRIVDDIKMRQEYIKLPAGEFVEVVKKSEKNFPGINILRGIKRFSKSLGFNNPRLGDDTVNPRLGDDTETTRLLAGVADSAKVYKIKLQQRRVDTQHISSTQDNYDFFSVLGTNIDETVVVNNVGIILRDLYFLKDDPESLGTLLSNANAVISLKAIGITPKDILLFKGPLSLQEIVEKLNVLPDQHAAKMINRTGLTEFADLATKHPKVFSTIVSHSRVIENIMKNGTPLSAIFNLGKYTGHQYFEGALKEYEGNWEEVKKEAIERSKQIPTLALIRANFSDDLIINVNSFLFDEKEYSFVRAEQQRRNKRLENSSERPPNSGVGLGG